MSANLLPPMFGHYSGELKADAVNIPLGAARFAGQVTNVFMSLGSSGSDIAGNELNVTGEVFINDVSCLSTQPAIAHITGEAAIQKTTAVTGDTGIVQAVVNKSANTFEPGDVVSATFFLTRTATPTDEVQNPCIVVELEPLKG